ncbi:MAG: homoserine kinase [Peptoniphilaceae bacterium]|nr:homoserine kinase [Peptoniphilaceae bacterium]MDY6085901.1 homoserine kinase [Peptoniphilaceae bacterium]
MQFTVRAPATSANLGPGFDCLGIAWNLYGRFVFHTREEADDVRALARYRHMAEVSRPADRNNMVLQAYWAYAEALNIALPDVGVFIDSDIPSTRGLGSSAACIVAGCTAARHLARMIDGGKSKGRLTDASVLRVATAVEGHPDNVAPALYGGLQLSQLEKGRVNAVPLHVAESLRFFVMIPDVVMSTKSSRGVLKDTVQRGDAVHNLSALGFLLEGLRTGKQRLIRLGLSDRLHEPQRRPLIPDIHRIEALVETSGATGMVLSGSGSTLLVFSHQQQDAEVERILSSGLPDKWQLKRVMPDFSGAMVMVGEGRQADLR